MNIQQTLYRATERKLVLWCIAAMLLMSSSIMLAAYWAATRWFAHNPAPVQAMHGELLIMLLGVQAVVVGVGTVLSVAFARKALQPIRQAHQAQADFAANAHHQLRTPIAVMRAEIDTALLRKPLGVTDKQLLQSLAEELQLLQVTSEKLLLLADGRRPDERHDIADGIRWAVRTLRARYPFAVTVHADPDVYTTLSKEELATMLEALLDNTMKHSGRSPDETKVTIKLRSLKKTVRLTYADNGRGVPDKDEKRLFERHYRGEQSRRDKTVGRGIGLSIVGAIVRSHQGTVWAGNSSQGGLRLTFLLPSAK